MELNLISCIPPSVNHYLQYRIVNRNGRYVPISYKSADSIKYMETFKKYVANEAKRQGWKYTSEKGKYFYVDTIFYLPRYDMDCSNYFKVMLDAITETGCVWKDDNIALERVNRIFYDTENPRIELKIYPVEFCGIFDNKDDLKEFEDKCLTCKNYCRNCQILERAKLGKIQDKYINDKVCLNYKENKGYEKNN